MHVLADNGGYVLAEDGARLLFLERRILPSWVPFVAGLLALITFGNGVVQLAIGNPAAGAVLVVLGALSALALRVARHSRRQAKSAPLDPSTALLVIDLGARTLLDASGRVLASLDDVRIDRSMQLTSSARALRVTWADGSAVVYRGDALQPGGSIAVATEALQTRGLTITG